MPAAARNQCPYCKETLKPDAIVCRHCHSEVATTVEPHGGTCPWCKESIHREALKCRHCFRPTTSIPVPADVADSGGCDCGPGNEAPKGAPGVAAQARYGCTACQPDGSVRTHFLRGMRTCWILLPIKIVNGVVTWRRIQWAERCNAYDLETNTPV
jgi:hypothetical protein